MAGLSSRFARAGYRQPKYMLPLAGRPMLDWSILSFAADLERASVLFIYRDVDDTAEFVRTRAEACGVARPVFVQLDEPTAGQAQTVALGLERAAVDGATPLTIFNIDTLRPGLREVRLDGPAGLLEVIQAQGDHWSFVLPDPVRPGVALRVTEKERVSDLCCTGLYAFRMAAEFRKAFARSRPTAGELFVAPLFNDAIADGAEVRYVIAPSDKVFFAGTPAEYEQSCRGSAAITESYACESA